MIVAFFKRARTVFVLLIALAPLGAHAVERITSFHSDITIHQDSSMTVKETINVVSEARTIEHGIVREFPTIYKDRWGNNYIVTFTIQSASLNGMRVPYRIESFYNGKKIYLGDSKKYLRPGKYSYVIEYETKRQLGFFDNNDELYWNVTGTGWRLPIDSASARVALPKGVPVDQISVEGYTGYQGSKGQHYKARIDQQGVAVFETTAPLKKDQGLTIVVTWPKGYVAEPSFLLQVWWFFADNGALLFALLGLLLLFLFYFVVWRRFRRSQRLDTIIPLFYPPKGMSPGLVRYFSRMKYDSKVLAADIVNMAVQGFLYINYKPASMLGFSAESYTLERKESAESLDGSYQRVLQIFFGTQDSIELTKKNGERIINVVRVIKHAYDVQAAPYFEDNDAYSLWGISIATVFGFGAFALKSFTLDPFLIVIFLVYVALLILFRLLLKGYTPKGLILKKEIEGFKMFLATTEEERFKIIGTPPTKTPELYETYLPYAIALGVEQQWSKKFAPVFEKMKTEGHPYTLVWISGGHFGAFNVNTFASNVSRSIASSIAASTAPPGRVSGSGGRGSSGGGGGGGGGGGW